MSNTPPARRRRVAASARAVPSGQMSHEQQSGRSGHNDAPYVTVQSEARARDGTGVTPCLAAVTKQITDLFWGSPSTVEGTVVRSPSLPRSVRQRGAMCRLPGGRRGRRSDMTDLEETTTAPSPSRWLAVAATGLLSGIVAALLLILLMAAARTWLGISPPPEALPDRFAPTIPIPTFFSLFDRFGGYNGLKRFGISSGLTGLLSVGAVFGVIYALVAESRRSRESGQWQAGLSRLAVGFIMVAALVLWVISLALLWPVLDANYRGAPPGEARLASAAALLVEYLVFAAVVILLYRWLAPRAVVNTRPAPLGEPVGRRAVVAGAAGLALAAGSGALIRNLKERATFSYDGLAYSGPGVQPIAPNDKFYTVTKNVVDPNI